MILRRLNSILLSFLVHFVQYSLCAVIGLLEKPSRDEVEFEKRGFKVNNTEIEFTPEFFQRHKLVIIGIISAVGVLLLCYFIAFLKCREGRNSIIFTMTLISIDFAFDILFIFKNGNDVQWLYLPSLVVLVGPICVNCFLSFFIIIYEIKNNEDFKRWVHGHVKFAAIMTIFSGADIEGLKLITSNFAGIKMFNANMSERSKGWILWGCVFNAVIEDLPQFVIQILYKKNTDRDYELIPFLTLITSSIILLIDVVSRVYDALSSSTNSTSPSPQQPRSKSRY